MRRDGRSSYQRVEYVGVNAPERLIWLHSNSDADWNMVKGLAAHPAASVHHGLIDAKVQ
jgi:hypothetical protein